MCWASHPPSYSERDVIIVDTHKPHLAPLYRPISHLVYAVGGSDVDTTIINGRVVMENRQLLSLDVDEVMDAVNRIAVEIGGAAYRPGPRSVN